MTVSAATTWRFEELAKNHELTHFDCGIHALNHWLNKHALGNQKQNLSRTFVAVPEKTKRVMGFSSLCPAQIEFQSLPKGEQQGPKYPRGVIRLARLAVDRTAQGKGLGAELLIEALLRAYRVSKEISTFGVVVDSKEGAKEFYLKYKFVPYHDESSSLFLPMRTIEQMLETIGLK
jgi:GNAT superfamily N-acetyltransferase